MMKNTADLNEFERDGDFKGAMDAWLHACREVEKTRADLQAKAQEAQEAKLTSENERRTLRRADRNADVSAHLEREAELNSLYWSLKRQLSELEAPEKPDLADFPGAEF